jgi:sugar lactone lactonase YvrE
MRWLLTFAALLFACRAAPAQDMPLTDVLLPGEGWKPLAGPFKSVAGLAADAKGNIHIADADARQVYKVATDGKAEAVGNLTGTPLRWQVAPDGRWQRARPMLRGAPHALEHFALAPDGGTLFAANTEDFIWVYRVERDGSLSAGQRYAPLAVERSLGKFRVRDLCTDAAGRLWTATTGGILFYDPTGRFSGKILYPERVRDAAAGEFHGQCAIAFGGPSFDQLYLGVGDKLFVRKMKAKGTRPVAAK